MSASQLPTLAAPKEPDLRRLWYIAVHHRWALIAIVACSLVVGAIATWLQTPRFESEAIVQLEDEEPGPSLLAAVAPAGLAAMAGLGSTGSIQTDIGVLRSRSIAEAVVDSLGLRVVLLSPKLPRDSVLQVLAAGRQGTQRFEVQLLRSTSGSYRVGKVSGAAPEALPQAVHVGTAFRLGDLELRLAPALHIDPPAEVRIAVIPFPQAVGTLRKHLEVSRPDPVAQLVQIHYEDTDPVLAAEVVNSLTRSFIQYKAHSSRDKSLGTIGFLEEQVNAYRTALQSAEAKLESFREQAQIFSPEEQAKGGVQRVAAMQAQRDGLAGERDALAQLLRQISAAAPGASERSPYRQLASFPSFLSNGAVQDMLRTLMELENERAELLVRRTPRNADVEALDQRVAEIERQLFRLASSYRSNLDRSVEALDENLATYTKQLETIPAREVQLLRLVREQKLLEQVYTLLETNLKEEQIQASRQASNVRVVDAALVPGSPSHPRPLINLALAVFLGFLAWCALVAGRELARPRVHSGADAVMGALGAPVLGMIPRASRSTRMIGGLSAGRRRLHTRPGGEAELVTRAAPHGTAAEAYRALRTSLLVSPGQERPQVIMMTSALPAEGKSLSAGNLAVALAQQEQPVLLIDADLRRGKLHRVFGLDASPGLSELLRDEADLAEVISEVAIPGFSVPLRVITAGALPPNPAELLGSARLGEVVQALRKQFVHIVLDTPPLNLVTDAAILSSVSDTTLLVARKGVTDRRALQHAAAHLRRLRVPLGGVVLTEVDEDESYRGGAYAPVNGPASEWQI
jgi:tyrosine-protein kinase Etk/Wzc